MIFFCMQPQSDKKMHSTWIISDHVGLHVLMSKQEVQFSALRVFLLFGSSTHLNYFNPP